ncbi:MAG TPA: type 1 glutamine amidotransferase [Alphaproteobacteria bacterium]|nr:type 1 glutamine amidotransferase [Alphaproteobacteria bacterium]
MRLTILRHVAYEGPGHIAAWAAARGVALDIVPVAEGAPLPDPGTVKAAIALGGPMSVLDIGRLPALQAEAAFLRELAARDRPVLGICLGAQMLAHALGGTVGRNPSPEIGWHTLTLDPASRDRLPPWPDGGRVLQWHEDRIEPPPGTLPLGRSAGCDVQGFLASPRRLGLQFHAEWTQEIVEALIADAGAPEPGPYVQDAAAIRAGFAEAAAHLWLFALLDRVFLGDGLG